MMSVMMSEASDLLSVPEAARAAGVSERTVWRWIRAGQVQTVRVGRRLLVRRSAPTGARIGEVAVTYGSELSSLPGQPEPGPWPYTAEKLEERRRIVLAERRAAGAEMDLLAVPVPRGYVEKLTRQVKDENRAWDGLRRGETAVTARARRRARQ
jgi:excisionase family DNA binding protein